MYTLRKAKKMMQTITISLHYYTPISVSPIIAQKFIGRDDDYTLADPYWEMGNIYRLIFFFLREIAR